MLLVGLLFHLFVLFFYKTKCKVKVHAKSCSVKQNQHGLLT